MKEKKLRIAILGIKGLPASGGAERVVESFIPHLINRGHEFWVYGDDWNTTTALPFLNPVKINSLPGKHLRATSLFFLSALHAITHGHFDVVHLHNTEAAFTIPLLKNRYPVVATSHGMAYRRDKWSPITKRIIRTMDIPFCRWPDVVTCVSKPLSNYYTSQYGANVRFIPNGVEIPNSVDQINAKSLLLSLGLRPKEYIIFTAGRILPTKGCHLLLQAVKKLREPIKVLVVGDITQVPGYADKLHDILPEQTVFLPLVKDKSLLFGLLTLSRLFIFPSTYEAMSMILLEVLALGIPLLCSNIPENMQIVSEEDLLFKSGDIESLSHKIKWTLNNIEKVKNLVTKVQQNIKVKYNWERIALLYLGSYYEAIEKRTKKQTPSKELENEKDP